MTTAITEFCGDFPAAHSMDTDWFAVDADGHVALFRSGEGGAVPESAAEANSGSLLPDDDRASAGGSGAASARSAANPPYRRAAPRTSEVLHEPPHGPSPEHELRTSGAQLVSVDDLAAVQADIDEARAVVMRVREGHAVFYEEISAEHLAALHEKDICRGCRSLYYEDDDSVDIAAQGVFVYDNASSYAAPYRRQLSPAAPARIDELPPDVRAAAAAVTLPIKFAESPELQPVDLVACATWSACYVPIGETEVRAVPGREAEWEKEQERAAVHAARAARRLATRGSNVGSGARVGRWVAIVVGLVIVVLVIVALVRR